MKPRYYARSASDRTDDWPFWYVADRRKGGVNVTADIVRAHINPNHAGGVLTSRDSAINLADMANGITAAPEVKGVPV